MEADLTGWMATSPLWEARGRRHQRTVRLVGVVPTLGGLAGVAAGAFAVARHGSAFLAVVAAAGLVAGLGVAAMTAGFELMVRTPQGSGLWVRVESFRRFLHDSEGPQAEEAAERGVLRQYTAWAIALDEVHHWSKAVEAAGAQIDDRGPRRIGLRLPGPGAGQQHPHGQRGSPFVGRGRHGWRGGGGFGGGGGGSW